MVQNNPQCQVACFQDITSTAWSCMNDINVLIDPTNFTTDVVLQLVLLDGWSLSTLSVSRGAPHIPHNHLRMRRCKG
jgi:hypothetical protein